MSSEEKLLKLIRKPAPKKVQESHTKTKKDSIDLLKACNRLLVIVTAGLLIFVVYKNIFLKTPEKDVSLPKISDKQTDVVSQEDVEEAHLFNDGEFKSRNIFQYPWEKTVEIDASGASGAPGVGLADLIRVTGILYGDSPQVIVEDKKTQQTFFLSAGEKIMEATVDEIKPDKAIFSYNGSKTELGP
jgi:hypothetical protein